MTQYTPEEIIYIYVHAGVYIFEPHLMIDFWRIRQETK